MKLARNKKRFVKIGIIMPIVLAVIAAAVYFCIIAVVSDNMKLINQSTAFSTYESASATVADPIIIDSNSVRKTELPVIKNNTIIGSIDMGKASMPLIYNANDVNAFEKANVLDKGQLIGEVGSSLIQIDKSSSDAVKKLNIGDKINLEVFYGNYVFEISDIKKEVNKQDVMSSSAGTGRAITIITDNSSGVGFSNNYYVVVGKLLSGITVTE